MQNLKTSTAGADASGQSAAGLAPGTDELSAEQRAAVVFGIEPGQIAPPLLIIAGAGSGKTKTLAARVAHLIASGADPQRILLMSFSRRAASELERRAGQMLQEALGMTRQACPTELPWSGTFHSVGARLLREYAQRIGLDPGFTVQDRSDAADLLGLARHELGLSETKNRFPTKDTCLAIYSRAVNSQDSLARVLARAFPWCAGWEEDLKGLFRRYVETKQAQHVLDYDDLLLYWAEMVADPALGAEMGARFTHVLVDEYQDTNRLQAAILAALKPRGDGLTVVGDDAQSIYSFRAAEIRNILEFPRLFDPPAACITLERNYRSSCPILAASNAVISPARERFAKTLWSERQSGTKPELVLVRDEADQARWVAKEVLGQREVGLRLRDQAVLFRSGAHSAMLELELARRNIPFVKYGGLKFLEAAHVKDLLSILRWADNPRNRLAGFRALQLVPGIGPATAARILDAVSQAESALAALAVFEAAHVAPHDWQALVTTFSALRRAARSWPGELELARQWYDPHLERLYEDARARRQDLEQLGQIAATYGTRERFLTELTLDPPSAASGEAGVPARDEDYLILSTIHSAKGQEWASVTVLNLVDGCIPSDMATGSDEEIEEERRLLYVAMTRAKDRLQLLVPQRFYVHQQSNFGDRHVHALRSRFVTDAMLGCFEVLVWPQGAPATGSQVPGAKIAHDVKARVRNRWG